MRFAYLAFAFLISGLVSATMSGEDMSRASQLMDSNQSCDNLSDGQLELIGEYYMERMHPGEQHEIMDRMMGGEGSESLRLQHIQMAQVLYCGRTDTPVTYGGMMAMMPMFYRGGWMQGTGGGGGMMGSGMMGGYGMGYDGIGGVLGLVFWALVFIVLVLLVYWLYRSVTGAGQAMSAGEILRQRYAKGEIPKKQYEEMKKDLEG